MELHARKMVRKTRAQGGEIVGLPRSAASVAAGEGEERGGGPRHCITVRYDTLLYDTLQNMIRSSHASQDFTYASLADFIRAALCAYKDGMMLTELDQHSPKVETSLRVERELWLFYKSLPGGMRSKILERVIRTFMKQQSEVAGPSRESLSQDRAGKRQHAG